VCATNIGTVDVACLETDNPDSKNIL